MAQLNYLQEPKNDPNAKSIADYVMPKPQPVNRSPVRATLPIPQTPAKAPVQPAGFQKTNYAPPMNVPNVSMPDVNVQPLLNQQPNALPDVSAPDVINSPVAKTIAAYAPVNVVQRAGVNAAKYVAPVLDAGANTIAASLGMQRPNEYGMTDAVVDKAKELSPPPIVAPLEQTIKSGLQASLGWTPAANAAPAPTAVAKPEPASAKPETGAIKTAAAAPADAKPTIAQNVQAKPAATSTSVPKPAKPPKAGKTATNPAAQAQPSVQAQADVGADPYAAYKARTGIDLTNVNHAPVPSYVQPVNQTQGMEFQNGNPANVDGSAVVPVETQEQFNKRWALINDFYNSPEGQAVISARQQGDVVEVQRGDSTSYTDLRNGGDKGIQDFIANQAAKDSALDKTPTSPMNNRELNQLDLLKPKLASETDIAQTGIAANASRDVASINNADEAVKTALLQEYMNPKTDPKRKEQLAPLFTSKDNKEIVVQGGEVYNKDSGQMQKVPSYVYDPSIKDYRYPNGANPNAKASKYKKGDVAVGADGVKRQYTGTGWVAI